MINNSIISNSNSYAKIKRDRGKNFLPIEREQLLQICSDYYEVIENKKTDSYSCKKKYDAWIEITKKFNKIQTTGLRNDKHLKTLYDNIKRDAKRPKNNGEKLYPPGEGHYLGNATSLCNVLINESANNYEPSEYDHKPELVNGSSNHLKSSSQSHHEKISFKEELSDVEPENAQPLSSSYSSKDSYTFECNYTSQLESMLQRKENSRHSEEPCDQPSILPEADSSDQYHKVRLKYLEIEHMKKMEILDLEQECLLLKRDYLRAKLKSVVQNDIANGSKDN